MVLRMSHSHSATLAPLLVPAMPDGGARPRLCDGGGSGRIDRTLRVQGARAHGRCRPSGQLAPRHRLPRVLPRGSQDPG